MTLFASKNFTADSLQQDLDTLGYVASDNIALTLFLAAQLEKPILVEGPPGVGKTELAKAASTPATVAWMPLSRKAVHIPPIPNRA